MGSNMQYRPDIQDYYRLILQWHTVPLLSSLVHVCSCITKQLWDRVEVLEYRTSQSFNQKAWISLIRNQINKCTFLKQDCSRERPYLLQEGVRVYAKKLRRVTCS